MTKTASMTGKQWMQMVEASRNEAGAAGMIEQVEAALNAFRASVAHIYGGEALNMTVANKTHTITLTIG